MIKLDAFIRAIQDAVLRANEGLIDSGYDSLVSKFFETEDSSDDVHSALTDALDATRSIKSSEDKDKARDALSKARDAIKGEGKQDIAKALSHLKAKEVTVQYPILVDGEIQYKDVHIPLVTLVPLNFSSIEEVKLRTDIEIYADNDDLQINFGKSGGVSRFLNSRKRAPGHLEITLKPDEGPEGVKLLIDGYERILRAQIPS